MSKERLVFVDRGLLDCTIAAVQIPQCFDGSHNVCGVRCSKEVRVVISFILLHILDPLRQAELSIYR